MVQALVEVTLANVTADPVTVQTDDVPEVYVTGSPELAAAVSVTSVPLANVALHVDAQLMPEGLLVTVPAPVPADRTVS